MYAVIRTGGKQYRVAKDDVLTIEKIFGDTGATVELDQVLMIGNGADVVVGNPLVTGAKVVAKVLEQTRADKILVFKKKRRKKYRRTQGHRRDITILRVTDLLAAGAKPAVTKAAAAEDAPAKKAASKAKAPAKAKTAAAKKSSGEIS